MAGIGFSQDKCSPYAKPGQWNDPDMLVVGQVGWGPSLHETRLTPDEQYTHISLWSLLASPLLIGCDMSQLDDFSWDGEMRTKEVSINFKEIGLEPGQNVRDLWRQKDLGLFDVSFSIDVNYHGVVLVKISTANQNQ